MIQPISMIAGFPGVGKSVFTQQNPTVHDSDSSKFDKADFPDNYITFLKEGALQRQLHLVSSHESVRMGLFSAHMPFTLVIPAMNLKEEYLERYKQRGSPQAFIDLMDKNWTMWINDCVLQPGCGIIELKAGQYLTDVITVENGRFKIL